MTRTQQQDRNTTIIQEHNNKTRTQQQDKNEITELKKTLVVKTNLVTSMWHALLVLGNSSAVCQR